MLPPKSQPGRTRRMDLLRWPGERDMFISGHPTPRLAHSQVVVGLTRSARRQARETIIICALCRVSAARGQSGCGIACAENRITQHNIMRERQRARHASFAPVMLCR